MSTMERISSVNVSNVLSEEKRQQVIALGRLGWSLRRIQRETHIRRETAANYLKSAGIPVREPGWARKPQSKPAIQVTPDSAAVVPVPRRSPSASACEPWRDWIASQLAAGRNAKAIWQDLIDDHAFTATYQSVKRFVRKSRTVAHARLARSSTRNQVRKHRLTTAMVRWCGIRTPDSIAAPGYSFSRSDTAVSVSGC